MNNKEFLPGEYAEDVIHIDNALRNIKDKLKIAFMIITFPIVLPLAIFTSIFYKQK